MWLICSSELTIKRLWELLQSHKRQKSLSENRSGLLFCSVPEEQKYRSKSHQHLNADYLQELNYTTSFGLAMLKYYLFSSTIAEQSFNLAYVVLSVTSLRG